MINSKKLVPDLKFGGGVGWIQAERSVSALVASQTGVIAGKISAPFPFQLEQVLAYARALTGTTSIAGVSIDGGANLITAIAPATNTSPPQLLAWSAAGLPPAARRGVAGSVITITTTTAAASTLTDLSLVVWLRPFPMAGEAN